MPLATLPATPLRPSRANSWAWELLPKATDCHSVCQGHPKVGAVKQQSCQPIPSNAISRHRRPARSAENEDREALPVTPVGRANGRAGGVASGLINKRNSETIERAGERFRRRADASNNTGNDHGLTMGPGLRRDIELLPHISEIQYWNWFSGCA